MMNGVHQGGDFELSAGLTDIYRQAISRGLIRSEVKTLQVGRVRQEADAHPVLKVEGSWLRSLQGQT